MKQLFQDLKSGNVLLEEVPCPRSSSNHLLVESRCSLVSSGTERALMEFGKAGYFGKARQQPDKVRQSIDKILTDGLIPTVEAITKKLDEPMPLGYSNVGLVLDEGTKGFSVGDRIVSNGFHAEVVRVPINLTNNVLIIKDINSQQIARKIIECTELAKIKTKKEVIDSLSIYSNELNFEKNYLNLINKIN